MTDPNFETMPAKRNFQIELVAGYSYSIVVGVASLAFIAILGFDLSNAWQYGGIGSIVGTMIWPGMFLTISIAGLVATIRLHRASKRVDFEAANEKGLIGYGCSLVMLVIPVLALLIGGYVGAIIGGFIIPGGLLGILITYSLQQRRRRINERGNNG